MGEIKKNINHHSLKQKHPGTALVPVLKDHFLSIERTGTTYLLEKPLPYSCSNKRSVVKP